MAVTYNASIITDGLKLCYDTYSVKSYPGSGTVLYDVSGNALNATLSSAITGGVLTSGRSATSPVTSILNTDFHSIFFFVRFNTTATYGSNGYSGSYDKIFSFNAGGSDRSPAIWRHPNERTLHWRYDPANTGCDFAKALGTGSQFDIDKWYYVGVVKNGSSATSYVNGVNIGAQTVAYPKTAGTASIIVYESHPTDIISIGCLHIYDRLLSTMTDYYLQAK